MYMPSENFSVCDLENYEESPKNNVLDKAWRTIIGTPISSAHELNQRLDKFRALAIFSSDALSSVAYGPEQVLLVLMAAGMAALTWGIPIVLGIVILVAIVTMSYWQTIHAYPHGGGSFTVAKENLGTLFGLTAASSLLTAYILTVVVSICAGVSAIVSVFPAVYDYKVVIGLFCILVLIIANLRGLRDSGTMFALPTYAFIFSVLLTILVGFIKLFILKQDMFVQNTIPLTVAAEPLTLWLILRAFATGSSTLTGIEAVSNGVPAFKPHEPRNAAITLTIMASLLGIMAMGIAILASHMHAVPTATETILSQIGRTVFHGSPIFYFVLQASTTLILILAANTAFADFPRLSSILAIHKFMPHQFSFRGDRLAFSNGIAILGLISAVVLGVSGGNERHLIPLYAVGVFVTLTLSQTGMVFRWWRTKSSGWKKHIAINFIGAVITFIVFLIISITKFTDGAWAIIIVIPLFVFVLHAISEHYHSIEKKLVITDYIPQKFEHVFIVPISKVGKHILFAFDYVRSLTNAQNIIAVHVTEDKNKPKTIAIEKRWKELIPDVPLIIIESPYRQLVRPLLDFVEKVKKSLDRPVTVVLSDYQPTHWWEHALHQHISFRLKNALARRHGVIIINTHYKFGKDKK